MEWSLLLPLSPKSLELRSYTLCLCQDRTLLWDRWSLKLGLPIKGPSSVVGHKVFCWEEKNLREGVLS